MSRRLDVQSEQWRAVRLSVSRLKVCMCVESGSEHDLRWVSNRR